MSPARHAPPELRKPAVGCSLARRCPGRRPPKQAGGNRMAPAGHSEGVTTDWASLGDEQLWSRAAEHHDGDAFGQLFERHADAVYAHCFRRTGAWSMAEDLTSVVFLEAWRRRRDVRFCGDSVLPWLLGVANNATRNAHRALRRHRRLLARLPAPEPVPDIAEDAAARADHERAVRWLLAELRGLGEPERAVLSLCDWAGLGYAEAAAGLGVPAGTVRSRPARARQHLRDRAAQGESRSGPAAVRLAGVTATGLEDQP